MDSPVLIVPIFSSSKSKHNPFFYLLFWGWLNFLVDVNLMIFTWSLIGYYSRFWVDVNLMRIFLKRMDYNLMIYGLFDGFFFFLDFLEKSVLNSWIFFGFEGDEDDEILMKNI